MKIKKTEKASDWDSIYNMMFHKRAEKRFKYDVANGIGAFDRREKEQLKELHQFFLELEKESDESARRSVIYI